MIQRQTQHRGAADNLERPDGNALHCASEGHGEFEVTFSLLTAEMKIQLQSKLFIPMGLR